MLSCFLFYQFFFLFLKSTGADGMVYWVKHFAGMAVFLYESDSSCPGRSVLPIQIPANVLGRQQMMLIDEGSCHLGRRSHWLWLQALLTRSLSLTLPFSAFKLSKYILKKHVLFNTVFTETLNCGYSELNIHWTVNSYYKKNAK